MPAHRRPRHQSATCKTYIAAKTARLVALGFFRTPPEEWTPEQQAAFEQWYPGDLPVAVEMIADPRLPAVLNRLGILNTRSP